MLKLTSVMMGALVAASIAQPTLAATNASSVNSVVARPADNLQAQLIIKIGDSSRSDDRYRYSDRDRERYERERWEAKRRRYYEHREYRERYRERYDDRRDYYRH
jgi:Ni/Co efflux regulator RcnB